MSTARGECAGGRTQPHSSEYILVRMLNRSLLTSLKYSCCRHKEQRQVFVHITLESLSRDTQLETRRRTPPATEERQFQFRLCRD
jgi:hypothetical protein